MLKRLIFLLAAAVLIWGGIWLYNSRDRLTEAGKGSWPDLATRKVTSFSLQGRETGVAFFRKNGNWLVSLSTHEEQASPRGDAAKVEALLDFVAHNRPMRSLGRVETKDLPAYGLAEPRHVFAIQDPVDWILKVGAQNVTGDGVYAIHSAEPEELFLLDRDFLDQFSRKAEFYFDMRLFSVKPEDIRSVRMVPGIEGSPGQDRESSRSGQEGPPSPGGWEISRTDAGYAFTWPKNLRDLDVSSQEVDFYIHSLASMTATKLEPGATDPEGIPLFTIQVTANGQSKKSEAKVFPSLHEGMYPGTSTWQSVPFVLGDKRVQQLDRSVFSLRDRSILSLDIGQVRRMRFTGKGRNLDVSKRDSVWTRTEGEGEVLGIDMLLWRLTELKFEAGPVAVVPDSASPVLVWEVLDADENTLARIAFYEDPDVSENRCWLKIESKEYYYLVSDKLLDDVLGQLPARPQTGDGP
jgi:hypothetical protein